MDVSIPYRLATNKLFKLFVQEKKNSFNPLQVSYKLHSLDRQLAILLVSIPYRLATNYTPLIDSSLFYQFQSLIGQLQIYIEGGQPPLIFQFQSLIGQLQICGEKYSCKYRKAFQSLIGQLQIKVLKSKHQSGSSSFNPLQVSYKLSYRALLMRAEARFQSLIGQLQISFCTLYLLNGIGFQSLIGQLQI